MPTTPAPLWFGAIYEAIEQHGLSDRQHSGASYAAWATSSACLPEHDAGKLYGVELDSISGRIAKRLYPNADITVAGFETTDRRNFYDLAIGNVPFGNYLVDDKSYNSLGFRIHNYFFAKALDQVRPGGVVAFVTSRYTMDSKSTEVRKYLRPAGGLLGPFVCRTMHSLPTPERSVVSDILFLQKRQRMVAWNRSGCIWTRPRMVSR